MIKYFLKTHSNQSPAEEMANAILHGFGVLFSIAALIAMIMASNNSIKSIVSCAIFGSTLISLYLFSTLYHSIWHVRTKRIFRILDHIMIYLLIAGTYTPFTLVGIQGRWGWSLFAIIWILALFGVIFKLFFTGRLEKLSIAIYIAMGWLAIVAIDPIFHRLSLGGILWIFAGGIAYTAGIVFYATDHRFRFAHSIWHLFVMLGSCCHVIAVLFFIIGKQAS